MNNHINIDSVDQYAENNINNYYTEQDPLHCEECQIILPKKKSFIEFPVCNPCIRKFYKEQLEENYEMFHKKFLDNRGLLLLIPIVLLILGLKLPFSGIGFIWALIAIGFTSFIISSIALKEYYLKQHRAYANYLYKTYPIH